MDPSRDLSQNGPENPCLSTENDMPEGYLERYFDFDGYYRSSKSSSGRHSLSPSRAGRSTSPDSFFPFHQAFSSSTDYYSSVWDQDIHSRALEMSAYSRSDDDGASVSGYSGHSPPDLVRGGSTSPSEHSSPYHSDYPDSPPQAATLREAQIHDDEWIPHSHHLSHSPKSPQRGYYQQAEALPGHHSKRTEDHSANLKRRRSGDGLEKRHRHLVHPSQTADVRKSGACIPCRVSKTRCHENGVCPTCRQAFPDHSTMVCLRFAPSGVYPMASRIPDIWSRTAREEASFLSRPRFFIGNPRRISIFFAKDINAPGLSAIVQAYQSQRDEDSTTAFKTCSFPNERMPLHPELQRWVESQMMAEHKSDFELALQSFLSAYSAGGQGLLKHNLVSKVHKLHCYFKIWKTARFWCLDPSNKLVNLPTSVQAQLREIARKAVYQYEMDVLKELDDCLTQQSSPSPQERLATWASMWQLIFIYRESLSTFRKYMDHVQSGSDEEEYKYNRKIFHKLSEVVFPMITVFYHYQFRTRKSIELSLDWLSSSSFQRQAVNGQAIRVFAQQMLDTRKDMLQKLQASKSRTDAQLCVFVVNHELKKLNARKRNPKTSSKSRDSQTNRRCDDD